MKSVKTVLAVFILLLTTMFTACTSGTPGVVKKDMIILPSDMHPEIKSHIEKLYSSNHTEQIYGAMTLGKSGKRASQAVPFLISVMNNEIPLVQKSIIKALGQIGDKRAVEPLISILKTKDSILRGDAAHALGHLEDKRAVDPLIDTLRDNTIIDEDIIRSVVSALGELKDPGAEEHLISSLRGNADIVAEALWEINPNWQNTEAAGILISELIKSLGDKRLSDHEMNEIFDVLEEMDIPAVKPLVTQLKDKDVYGRGNAFIALERLGWHPADQDEIIAYLIAGQKWDEIITVGEPAIPYLVESMSDDDKNVRASAVKALVKLRWHPSNQEEKIRYLIAYQLWDDIVKIREPAIIPLINVLNDKNSAIQNKAAEALAKIGVPSTEQLIATLGDKRADVRNLVAYTLKKIDRDWRKSEFAKKSADHFIDNLKDVDKDIRISSAWALGQIMDAKAITPLIETLNDEDAGVRQYAVNALGSIADPDAVEPLIMVLRDNDSAVRGYAALALGDIKDTRAIEPLINTMKDKESWPVDCAKKALQKIDPKWSDTEIAKRAIPAFIVSLKDGDNNVIKGAAKALGEIRDPSAVEPLIAVLKDENKDIRSTAALALAKIGDPKAVEPLIQILENKKTRTTEITYALGKIKDARAVEPLIEAMEDKSIRTYAARALVKITGEKFGENPEQWQSWWQKNNHISD